MSRISCKVCYLHQWGHSSGRRLLPNLALPQERTQASSSGPQVMQHEAVTIFKAAGSTVQTQCMFSHMPAKFRRSPQRARASLGRRLKTDRGSTPRRTICPAAHASNCCTSILNSTILISSGQPARPFNTQEHSQIQKGRSSCTRNGFGVVLVARSIDPISLTESTSSYSATFRHQGIRCDQHVLPKHV